MNRLTRTSRRPVARLPRARPAFLLAAALLSGCVQGPDFTAPEINSPQAFRNGPEQPDAASLADLPWWEVFNDPALQSLVREALVNNYDIRIAIARIEQARALEVQTASSLYPQIGYEGAIARGRNSVLGSPTPNNGSTSSSALLTLNAFWEIDLWGRIRRADEAALARILAAEESRRGIMLSLTTGVAQAYFELIELDLEIEISRRNVRAFEETRDYFTRRSDGGVGSRVQVLRAQANLAQVAATIPELRRLIAIKENQISLLLGRDPGSIPRGRALLEQSLPVDIPAGIPAALLQRRPDIRQAEQSMVAANALIGAAMADYFPRIGLTAFVGKVSPELSAFSGGTTNAWSVAGGLAGPIFTAGRTQAQVDEATARFDEARLQYEQTVKIAFNEVANTLVTREQLADVEAQLRLQVAALSESVTISRQRYDLGRASYFEILDAQQQLFPAETSLARTLVSQDIAVIQLYRVLGGGWNVATEDWSVAAP
ncbi:MAG: efflux transporter outer membrane subunit [Phycisphaerales bacterium]